VHALGDAKVTELTTLIRQNHADHNSGPVFFYEEEQDVDLGAEPDSWNLIDEPVRIWVGDLASRDGCRARNPRPPAPRQRSKPRWGLLYSIFDQLCCLPLIGGPATRRTVVQTWAMPSSPAASRAARFRTR
jgi:hypothetical protein